MDEEFISSLVETIAAGVVENCAGRCEDFSPAHIIKQRVVTSCDTVWYLTLQVTACPLLPLSTSYLVSTYTQYTIGYRAI